MKIKISDNYVNEFITTQKGFIIKKGEQVEPDMKDFEVKQLLQQGILVITKDSFNNKIINDNEIDNSVKEVITKNNVISFKNH